jgi:Raf kinase inhibitor-like YbhB/YbcL family protein
MKDGTRWDAVLLLGLCSAACAACNGCQSSSAHPAAAPGVTLGSLTVTSTAFAVNGPIPVDCTCDGADRSPPLTWSAAPSATKSIAVVVDDPDAPGGTFVHWVAFNLPPTIVSLPEGADAATIGGISGTNGFGHPGYGGPCPPRREVHRYRFLVRALDAQLDAKAGASRDAVDAAMSGHVLAEGTLVGVFEH